MVKVVRTALATATLAAAFFICWMGIRSFNEGRYLEDQNATLQRVKSSRHEIKGFVFGSCASLEGIDVFPATGSSSREAPLRLIIVTSSQSPLSVQNMSHWQELLSSVDPSRVGVVVLTPDPAKALGEFQAPIRKFGLHAQAFRIRDIGAFRAETGIVGVPMTLLADSSGRILSVAAGVFQKDALTSLIQQARTLGPGSEGARYVLLDKQNSL